MPSLLQFFRNRKQSILLALMLETLHLSIWLEFGSPISRSLMMVHLGLFLIWQPVWRGDQKLPWHNGVIYIVLTAAFVFWLNWLLLFCWLILLIGFCGGRVSTHRHERFVNIIVLVFLISELLITCTVSLFQVELSKNVGNAFRLILPVLPLGIIVFRSRYRKRLLYSVDFIQAITTALLISLLVIGSLLNMYRSGTEYLVALIQTLIAIGGLLLIISWLLTPHAGFSGLSQLWMRSILSLGTPLEQWLEQIAGLFEQQNSPDEFLEAVMEELLSLPWISGVKWKTSGSDGTTGETTRYETMVSTDNLVVRIYTHSPVGGALFLHCKLLVNVIDNFFEAKLREKKLTQQTHLQAIYETGARVTHDIKNLLQSLHAITSMASEQKNNPDNSASLLIEKQLPHLSQRLQSALDKLQAPEATLHSSIGVREWWDGLLTRNTQKNIEFQADIVENPMVSVELFDTVMENLLENIRNKKQLEPDINVKITLFCDSGSIVLTVCDDGMAMPEEMASQLLKDPVKSDFGLGIGLFQVAKQARANNFSLSLLKNQDGRVCFALKNLGSSENS